MPAPKQSVREHEIQHELERSTILHWFAENGGGGRKEGAFDPDCTESRVENSFSHEPLSPILDWMHAPSNTLQHSATQCTATPILDGLHTPTEINGGSSRFENEGVGVVGERYTEMQSLEVGIV